MYYMQSKRPMVSLGSTYISYIYIVVAISCYVIITLLNTIYLVKVYHVVRTWFSTLASSPLFCQS